MSCNHGPSKLIEPFLNLTRFDTKAAELENETKGKFQSCGQSLHRFSKRWPEFQILRKMAKLWLRFLKVWLSLNVTDENNGHKGKNEFLILRKVAKLYSAF